MPEYEYEDNESPWMVLALTGVAICVVAVVGVFMI